MNIIEEIDTSISEKLANEKLKQSVLITLFSYIGSVFSILVFLIILFFYFKEKSFVIESICSLAYATGIVFVLKFTVKRQRNTSNIDKFRQKVDPYSFPSGHISRIFAVISPFYSLLYVSITTSILGSLAAFARISKGYHYLSDCIVGSIIGVASSFLAKMTLKFLSTLIFQ